MIAPLVSLVLLLLRGMLHGFCLPKEEITTNRVMSQDKKPHTEFGVRLKAVRMEAGLSQSQMAEKLEIATSTYQYYERGERDTPGSVIKKLTAFGVNPVWIVTGEGSSHLAKSLEIPVHEGSLKISEFLEMTRKVLRSETNYSYLLMTNIRSFYQAMTTEQQFRDLENRIAQMEQNAHCHQNDRLRHDDPPDQKEEILNRRAMPSAIAQ